MKKLIAITFFLLLIGCTHIKQDTTTHESENTSINLEHQPLNEKHKESDQQSDMDKHIDYSNYAENRFSYLEQLSISKQKDFEAFMTNKELHYLNDFSPEEMVIVYFHLLSMGDSHSIYHITYNGEVLPDQETFIDEYNKYSPILNSDIVFQFRYFDSIKIVDTVNENYVAVSLTVAVGIHTHSLLIGLYKENDMWKLDLYTGMMYNKETISTDVEK